LCIAETGTLAAPGVWQAIVKMHGRLLNWGHSSNRPEILLHPGMKDIKCKELPDKWRPLIPVDKREECKCHKDNPREAIRGKVKANTKAAKAA